MRAPLTFARALTRANTRTVKNASGPELWIYDEIGFWGITASDVARELAAVAGQRVTVRVNSPGGEVFDGIAIYNLIRGHVGGADVVVDGLAASAASFIAMAGETVTMAPNSRMMIHDALGLCIGNAADMLDTAALLDDLSANIAAIYDERTGDTGGGVDAWRERMKAETWLSPEQASALGLVDVVADPAAAAPDDGEQPADGEEDPVARYRASMAYQLAEVGKLRAEHGVQAAGQPRTGLKPAARARATTKPQAFAAQLTAADGEYLDCMLEHHACSLGATRGYLAVGEQNRTGDVTALAEAILTAQTSDVEQMSAWLTAAGLAPEAPEGPSDSTTSPEGPSVDGAAILRMMRGALR